MRFNLNDPKYYKDPMETAQDYEEFERLRLQYRQKKAQERQQFQPATQQPERPLPTAKRA